MWRIKRGHMQTERDNHVPEVPGQNEADPVESVPDDRASPIKEGPSSGGVETVQPIEYDMEYLIRKAKQYHSKSEDEFSFICERCGKTFGEHFGNVCERKHAQCFSLNIYDNFIENKKATEFFNALRQIVKYIKIEP
jgi:hypothetical protein